MSSNPSPSTITGSVEVSLQWSDDFALTDTGDLLLAADTITSPDATIQRLTRLILTTASFSDPNTGVAIQADDIFNPTWGASARAYVGATVNSTMIQKLRTQVVSAVIADPGVLSNPPPTVSVAMIDTYTLLMTVQFTQTRGQVVSLQVQMNSSGAVVLPTPPSSI